MGKTDTRMLTRRQKALSDKNNINTEGQTDEPSKETKEDAPIDLTDEQEKRDLDEQDSQMDAVIEVKGSTPTITVSWEKNEKNDETEEIENRTSGGDEMTTKEPDIVGDSDSADNGTTKREMEQEMEGVEDEQKSPMDVIAEESGPTPKVAATCEKNEEVKSNHKTQETNGGKRRIGKESKAFYLSGCYSGKRKAQCDAETSPSKKAKLINDGFCLYVGNLNTSKTSEELTDSIANYFMKHSLLVEDIRLDSSNKHAYVDLASEMDLTKALKLNGEKILDKPVKIVKAKVKSEDKVKMTIPPLGKKDRDSRCLCLRKVPCNATKAEILEIFNKAIDVQFPGGTQGPSKGVAFVEFESKTLAKKVKKEKQGVKIQDQDLVVEMVGEKSATQSSKGNKAKKEDNSSNTKVPPNNILYVSNLSANAAETHLKWVFRKAVQINIPHHEEKSRKFAFVTFATVADATKALQSSKNVKICKRTIKVNFSKTKGEKPENAEAIAQSKTLIVRGLSEKTTAAALKSAFEGAVSTRVAVNKDTGVSKRFGFVEFENNETCNAAKEALEDCEIDGRKVTLDYAKTQRSKGDAGPLSGKKGQKRSRRVPPNNILFVNNLSPKATKSHVKKVFQNAVKINIPQNEAKSRGFAFVEFATLANAAKALQSSQNLKICDRTVSVSYAKVRENTQVHSKTLIVSGLAAKTTADTLRNAFEGAVSTRVAVDKDTGVSKRFGFVDFDSEIICEAFKEAVQYCKIDGCVVNLDYAKAKSERGPQAPRGGGDPGAGPEGPGGSGGRRSRRGKGAGSLQEAVENKS